MWANIYIQGTEAQRGQKVCLNHTAPDDGMNIYRAY